MGMSSGGKGGSYGMSAPGYGYGSPTVYGPVPSNPALPLNGAPMGPPQFYQPSNQGLIPGLGSGPMQTPYYPSGGGYYGGDSLGTAGQLLSGGTPPSFNPAAGGNPEGIGYFGPTGGSVGKGGGTTPPPPGGSGGGKGSGGLGKGGSGALPPPAQQQTGVHAPAPGMQQLGAMGPGTTGMQAPGNPGAALQQFPNGAMTPPGAANGASPAPQAAPNFGAPPSFNATQLAQANGVSPGLADFMLNHNQGNPSANQQFEQAAGFTNPAGSQTALNQAGRNWIMNNEQSYGNINADAGQASPQGHLGYGMVGNTPYSYSLGQAATNPALQQWLLRARSGIDPGPPPTGANVYGQFRSGGSGG